MGESKGNIIIYQTDSGKNKIDVKLENDTVWLSQEQMALLFNKAKSTINEHIANVFAEGELQEEFVMRKFGNSEFSTKPTNYYNLDVIISVGYRVKSQQGTRFRIWATERLREYIVKGFTMDDDRLKQSGGGNYFIHNIRRNAATTNIVHNNMVYGLNGRTGFAYERHRHENHNAADRNKAFALATQEGKIGLGVFYKYEGKSVCEEQPEANLEDKTPLYKRSSDRTEKIEKLMKSFV